MCGIFLYLGSDNTSPVIYNQFMKSKSRGPDNSNIYIEENFFLGFHRLMINDLTLNGNQPMIYGETILICNGEIYNFKNLIKKYALKCESKSDCEVIILLYNKLKNMYSYEEAIHQLCNELDGEFAFIIYDKILKKLVIVRDRYGVRPLFYGFSTKDEICNTSNTRNTRNMGFASDLKNIDELFDNVEQFRPSTYKIIDICNVLPDIDNTYYKITEEYSNASDASEDNEEACLIKIKDAFEKSVEKRLVSDVPMCALLSGGVDSSLVCGVITNKIGKGKLDTFSIGLEGSTDLYYAKKVAEHIGSIHHEVIVTKEDMLNSIDEVIKNIESYDITTVRASIPNYLVAKYIKDTSEFKCVFSGEMSDEMMGGYLYFNKTSNGSEFAKECDRLLENICYFDNLRADKCISSHQLEARVPFSDHHLAKIVQSINPELRKCNDKIEKYLLRKAFDKTGMLPDEILWRKKEAFSDAVSSKEDSWYKTLQTYIDTKITDEEFNDNAKKYEYCTPMTKEAYYYRKIYATHYKNQKVIPYFWLPKKEWCGIMLDPSAREL
jgi:asparagine synthase (glutamine-hydrolysing)